MPYQAYEYSAFISYYHPDCIETGRHWAQWIQQLLETFPTAPELAGKPSAYGDIVPHSMPRVFLDKTEVAAGGELPAVIESALSKSRVLIVVCSPNAATKSEWIPKEILAFKKLGRLEPIIAVVIDGEPFSPDPRRECYPEPLRFPLQPDGTLDRMGKADPVWVDFRGVEETPGATSPEEYREALSQSGDYAEAKIERCVSKYTARFEDSRLRLLAGVLGLPMRELSDVTRFRIEEAEKRIRRELEEKQKQEEEQKKREEAFRQREEEFRLREAQHHRQKSWLQMGLVVVLVGALAAVGFAYLRHPHVEPVPPVAPISHQTEEVIEQLRKSNEAMAALIKKMTTDQVPISTQPEPKAPAQDVAKAQSPEQEKLTAEFNALIKNGEDATERGQQVEAQNFHEQAAALADAQLKNDPQNVNWLRNRGWARHRAGEILLGRNLLAEALKTFTGGIEDVRLANKIAPEDIWAHRQIAMIVMQRGNTYVALKNFDAAEADLSEALKTIDTVVAKDNADNYRCDKAVIMSCQAGALFARAGAQPNATESAEAKKLAGDAVTAMTEGMAILKKIPADSTSYQYSLIYLYLMGERLGGIQAWLGGPASAAATRRETVGYSKQRVEAFPENIYILLNVSRSQSALLESLVPLEGSNLAEAKLLVADGQDRLRKIQQKPGFARNDDFTAIENSLTFYAAQTGMK